MSGASSQPVSPSNPLPIPGERRFVPRWSERLSAPLRALPNLLVIGAQKCGTSSLHEFLRVQREVRMSRIKECNVLWTPAWSLREYRAYFPLRATCLLSGVKRVGESSPFYLFHPAAVAGARRLEAEVRDLRAIAVLRDPVERAWSHYKHEKQWHGEAVPFEQALDLEAERIAASEVDFRRYSYQSRGDYAPQLARWFDLLGRDRVLVLEFTEVLAMRAETRAEIAGFLGLSGPLEGEFGGFNLGRREELPAGVRARLEKRFHDPNERLAKLLGRRFAWMR